MEKISCEIIKDLLPSYRDEVLTDSVKLMVENHLESCNHCKGKLKQLEQEIEINELEQKSKGRKFIASLQRRKYYLIGMMIGAMIPIGGFVALIVYFVFFCE